MLSAYLCIGSAYFMGSHRAKTQKELFMSNPLLTFTDLPPFSQIKPEHIKPAVEQAIADCRAKVEEVLKDNTNPTWENVIAPLEEIDDRLSRIWSPVGHMNSVVNSEALREAYESCLPICRNTALGLVSTKACTKRTKPSKRAKNLQR